MLASDLIALEMPLARLGFVGVGWIGANRLRALAAERSATLVGISDVRSDVAEEVARSIEPDAGDVRVLPFEALLESGIDGIVIATPNSEHMPQALAALDRGIHVFCQKPLARTRAEAARIIASAREADCLLDVDFCYRHIDGVPDIKRLIAAGEIGKVYAADLTFHNAYGPDKPWFFDARTAGGGCVMDLGIHLIDLLLWALDYPKITGIDSRLYRGGAPLRPGSLELENYATATLNLSGDVTARLACSWHLPAGCDAAIEATFIGTRGALRLRNLNGSFFDLLVEQCEGTACRTIGGPTRDWSWGSAPIRDWATRLRRNPGFDPAAARVEAVHRVIDGIYGR